MEIIIKLYHTKHMKKIQSSHLATTWAVYTAYIAAITLVYMLTLFT